MTDAPWHAAKRVLYLDLETFCETPITHGTHKYAESAEVLLVAVARNDSPVEVWDTQDLPNWRSDLQFLIDIAGEVVIQNSVFDRTVLRHQGVTIPVEKITDTMVLALQHSLPGSLGALCDVLGVPQDKAKDKAGKKLIQLFTKPLARNRKLRRATRDTHPEEWSAFIEYARLDVDAMRHVLGLLPRWNDTAGERALWLLDQAVNDRGVAIDLELARSALRAFERTSRSLAARAGRLTDGAVSSLTQRNKFLEHLREEHDFVLADATKGSVAAALDDAEGVVQELLEIRQQAAATSPAKYKVLLNATSSDGRLRGTIQYCGASRTMRDAGRLFQPQNLPRPAMPAKRIEVGIEAMKADCEDLLFDNVSELCASAIRGCLIPAPGCKFVVSDLSNIEGRVAAWLAGEEWKIQAFRDFDRGIGPDLYIASYARTFSVPIEQVIDNKKNGDGSMRQIGKILELSMGYQGSVGAFAKMGGAALGMGEERTLELVRAWRNAHPNIRRFWYDLEGAAKGAIRNPDMAMEVRGIRFDMKQGWLRMRDPTGSYIGYPNARIDEDSGQILFDGVNQYTRKWGALETYGGKLFENLTQKTARHVFKHGLRKAEAAGYKLVIPVHDEAVCEVPDSPEYTAEALSACLATNPSWAVGLPLAASGHEMYRYAKGD